MLTRALHRVGAPHLIVACTFLLCLGLLFVWSASDARAQALFDSRYTYLWRQLGGAALGVAAAWALARTPVAWLERAAYALWGVATVSLAATLTPLGLAENGAQRWLALGPLHFQPLEFAKLGVVLAVARWLAARESRLEDPRVSLGGPALLAGVPALLLVQQPNLGGAVLVVAFAGVLVFVAGAPLRHLAPAGALGLAAALGLALHARYRQARLGAYLDPWEDPTGGGYQLVQSQLAFGAGGIPGVGLGAGQQKLGFLPEAHTDFILSVIGEELGLLGVAAILVGFAVVALAALGVAARAGGRFAVLAATGAGLLLWLQALLNAAVATGLLPTTGTTLPLVSYGRTSLFVSLAALGVLLSAARPARRGRSGWR